MERDLPLEFVVGVVLSDQFHVEAVMTGPPDTPYEGGVFRIDIQFDREWPYAAWSVKFVGKVYHPNIDEDGKICGMVYCRDGAFSLKLRAFLLSVYSLLIEPNLDEPLMPEIAKVYMTNRDLFNERARDWTKKYAR